MLCQAASCVAVLLGFGSSAQVVYYEGDILPTEQGFGHVTIYDPVSFIQDGWLVQQIDQGGGAGAPYDGDYETYTYELGQFAGTPFFIEWHIITDAPDSEVDVHNGGARMIAYGGPVNFHFNMASGLARILRGYPYPTEYFDIEPGVPHTYRLEVYGAEYFEFTIDGVVMDSGKPEAAFPTADSELIFGARYYQSGHTTQWDYVRFGTIPEPATGAALLSLSVFALVRRRCSRAVWQWAAHARPGPAYSAWQSVEEGSSGVSGARRAAVFAAKRRTSIARDEVPGKVNATDRPAPAGADEVGATPSALPGGNVEVPAHGPGAAPVVPLATVVGPCRGQQLRKLLPELTDEP